MKENSKSSKRGRPLTPLTLSTEDRQTLKLIASRPTTSQRSALRAQIVLLAAEGLSNVEIGRRLKVIPHTVGKWRKRYLQYGLEALLQEPRPRASSQATDAKVEEVITTTLETKPEGKTHWSQRDMARKTGLSQSTIHRIWKTFGLQPHRVDSFKMSTDPQFVAKVRDIVGLYMQPPEHAIVLCIDEKSQIQALNRSQPILPLRPGVPEQQTHDYKRNGTTTLFAALNAHTGEVVGKCFRRHRAKEYLRFLNHLAAEYADYEGQIHVIVDNYSTHKTPSVRRWFVRHHQFHVHFTPTYASWINLVERLFAELTDKAIRRGSFPSVRALEKAIKDYLQTRENKPFIWTATAEEIFRKVAKYCDVFP